MLTITVNWPWFIVQLLGLAGTVGGFYNLGRQHGSRSVAAPTTTTCGCGHDLALHNRDTHTCHHQDSLVGGGHKACPCQTYTGPELLPTVIASDIAGLEA